MADCDEARRVKLMAELDALRAKFRRIPCIDPIDIRYRRFETMPKPVAQAVMFCLMDVSGSMSVHMKDIAKHFYTLLYVFLTRRYRHVEIVFIRHTNRAEEVDDIPNATLETFADVIANGFGKYEGAIAALPLEQRAFFDNQSGFLSKTYTETRNQLIWRLQFLLSNPIIRQMFSAMKTKLDIGKEMDAGKVILIDKSKKRLGDEGSEFFGRFFIALVLAAAEQRAGRRQDQKKPCYFYIDECQNVIRRDEKISAILDQCRSQKIGMILAHERTAPIINDNVLDALANCAIRMANSDDEAKYLSDKLRSDTETLLSLPRGTFATFVRDHTRTAIALKVGYVDLSQLRRLSPAEQREIRTRMRLEYSFTPIEASVTDPPVTPQPQQGVPDQEPSRRAPARHHQRPRTPDDSETGPTW